MENNSKYTIAKIGTISFSPGSFDNPNSIKKIMINPTTCTEIPKDVYPYIYENFLKIFDDDRFIIGSFVYTDSIRNSDIISKPKIGERFRIGYWSTSPVLEIFSPNMFLTKNSVYFIIDEKFRTFSNRNDKIDELLNKNKGND